MLMHKPTCRGVELSSGLKTYPAQGISLFRIARRLINLNATGLSSVSPRPCPLSPCCNQCLHLAPLSCQTLPPCQEQTGCGWLSVKHLPTLSPAHPSCLQFSPLAPPPSGPPASCARPWPCAGAQSGCGPAKLPPTPSPAHRSCLQFPPLASPPS